VAGIEESCGDLDAAFATHETILEIARDLAEELGTPGSKRDLGISLARLGGIEESRGNFDAALVKYEEGLEIDREFAQALQTHESLRALSISLRHVARVEKARGDLDAALVRYVESLEIARVVAEQLGTLASLSGLALCLEGVGRIKEARGDLESALLDFEEGLRITRQILQSMVNRETRNHWLWITHLTASCLLNLRRSDEARVILAGALESANQLKLTYEDDSNVLDTCAAFHETYAKASAALGRADEAQRRSERGAAIRACIAALKDGGRQ
jgi:tetratricopeptide (TPR) repeat protein